MKLRLPVPPSVNAMYRNVRGVGRVKTKVYKDWAAAAGYLLKHQSLSCSILVPVSIHIKVPTNNRRDLDNHAKPIIDALDKAGIIDNDRCKCVREIHMGWHDETDCLVTVEAA